MPPADPDTLRQIQDSAQHVVDQSTDLSSWWQGLGIALGGFVLFCARHTGSGRVVTALHQEGNETRRELRRLSESIAHLAGHIEGMQR